MATLLSAQLFVAAVATGAIYALVGVGLNLVYGTLRLLNIAHGDIVMIGAYVAVFTVSIAGVSPLVALPISALLAAMLGVVTYFGLFSFVLRNDRLAERLESNSLLIFFGVSIVLQNGAALIFSNNQRGYRYLDEIISFAGVSIATNRLVALVVSIGLVATVVLVLRNSIYGLALRAVIQSRDASAIVGIDLRKLYLASLAVGFALAAMAGVLVSLNEQVSPFMGFGFSISAFIVIMLGGLGNLWGGLAAAMVLGVVETYGLAVVGASYRSILFYGVFVAVLLLRPEGLFGRAKVAR